MFRLTSDITIGGFQFTTVARVRVKRSISSPADMCYITLPAYGRITTGKRADAAKMQAIRSLFKEGDKVVVKLGYNGKLETEFEGFVLRKGFGNPFEIECEGWSYRLRLSVSLKGYYSKITAGELLQLVAKQVPGLKVTVNDDLPLLGIRLMNANGIDVIKEIKRISAGTLNIFFIAPNHLWCGFVYLDASRDNARDKAVWSQFAETKYRIGYNCIRNSGLTVRMPAEKVQVIMNGMLVTGDKVRTQSEEKYAQTKVQHTVNQVGDIAIIKKMAQELQLKKNYTGVEGRLTAFLQPFCNVGYGVTVTDARNSDISGRYVVEGCEVDFGTSGARRILELGSKIL